jgi:LacI family transcriptional regulator
MEIKIMDVAARAGVSSATVSRVVNNKGNVTPRTRERVLKVIREMGYQPNAAAKSLRSQKTKAIGVIVQEINHSYYAEIVKGIQREAYANKYNVFICDTENNRDKEREFFNLLMNRTVDAMILVTPLMADEEICRFAEKNYCIGIIGRNIQHDQIPCVLTDNVKFSKEVVDHLVSQGHREIAFLSGFADAVDSYERLEGYLKALREHQLPFDPGRVENGNFSEKGGYEAVKRLFEKGVGVTAIYAANDEMALGIYRYCEEHGIKIPEQLAVVGVDNNRIGRYITPKLSTVRQPTVNMGISIMQKLIHRLETGEIGKERVLTLESQLIVRDSSNYPIQQQNRS